MVQTDPTQKIIQSLNSEQERILQDAFSSLPDVYHSLLWELIIGDEFELNPEQIEALFHDHDRDGPLLILAGAGSGKTAVMTRRIVYLYLRGVAPENLLAITFTNKAAEEMRDRVKELLENLVQKADHEPIQNVLGSLQDDLEEKTDWIGTFHSVCKRILELEDSTGQAMIQSVIPGMKPPLRIMDPDKRWELLETTYKSVKDEDIDWSVSGLDNQIKEWRRNLVEPRTAKRRADTDYDKLAAKLYKQFQRTKVRSSPRRLDFQDLLFFTAKLLKERSSARRQLQDKFKHVLIDEFQDTNPLQFTIANQLAKGAMP